MVTVVCLRDNRNSPVQWYIIRVNRVKMEHRGIEYFQNKGKELGYKDEELRSYVKEQCDIEKS